MTSLRKSVKENRFLRFTLHNKMCKVFLDTPCSEDLANINLLKPYSKAPVDRNKKLGIIW